MTTPPPPPGKAVTAARIPTTGYMDTMTAAMEAAVTAKQGVALWAVLQQMRQDGYGEMADEFDRGFVRIAMDRAKKDPELYAQLLHLVHEAGIRVNTPAPARATEPGS